MTLKVTWVEKEGIHKNYLCSWEASAYPSISGHSQKITSRIFLVVQDNQGLTYAHATAITGMPHFNHKRHFFISMSEWNYTMFKFWTTLAFPWACAESLCVFILFPSLCDISIDSRCLCCPSWFPCICVLYAWFSIHWCSMKLCYILPKGLWENDEYVVEYQCNLQQVLGTVILEVVQV